MRHYTLEIAKGSDFEIKLASSYKNRTPVNISFEINSYTEGSTNVPGFIKIYNPSPQVFTTQRKFIDKQLTLWAGWENSIYLKKIGYSQIYDNLLVNAKISGVSGDYIGLNPYVMFYFQAWSESEAIKHTAQTSSLIKIQVPPNEPIIQIVLKALETLTSWKVIAHSSLMGLLNTDTQTLVFFCSTISELLNWLKTAFSIIYRIDTKTQKITLLKQDLSKEERAADISANGAIKLIMPPEFLSQPQLQNVGGQFVATLRLRPDLRVGQYIQLGTGVVASFANMQSPFVNATMTYKMQAMLKNLFQGGVAQITKVQHLGDFMNISAESWSTMIEFILVDKGLI